jgi:hypothetical protein
VGRPVDGRREVPRRELRQRAAGADGAGAERVQESLAPRHRRGGELGEDRRRDRDAGQPGDVGERGVQAKSLPAAAGEIDEPRPVGRRVPQDHHGVDDPQHTRRRLRARAGDDHCEQSVSRRRSRQLDAVEVVRLRARPQRLLRSRGVVRQHEVIGDGGPNDADDALAVDERPAADRRISLGRRPTRVRQRIERTGRVGLAHQHVDVPRRTQPECRVIAGRDDGSPDEESAQLRVAEDGRDLLRPFGEHVRAQPLTPIDASQTIVEWVVVARVHEPLVDERHQVERSGLELVEHEPRPKRLPRRDRRVPFPERDGKQLQLALGRPEAPARATATLRRQSLPSLGDRRY